MTFALLAGMAGLAGCGGGAGTGAPQAITEVTAGFSQLPPGARHYVEILQQPGNGAAIREGAFQSDTPDSYFVGSSQWPMTAVLASGLSYVRTGANGDDLFVVLPTEDHVLTPLGDTVDYAGQAAIRVSDAGDGYIYIDDSATSRITVDFEHDTAQGVFTLSDSTRTDTSGLTSIHAGGQITASVEDGALTSIEMTGLGAAAITGSDGSVAYVFAGPAAEELAGAITASDSDTTATIAFSGSAQ